MLKNEFLKTKCVCLGYPKTFKPFNKLHKSVDGCSSVGKYPYLNDICSASRNSMFFKGHLKCKLGRFT